MSKYKIIFTELEINTFNTLIESELVRVKMMSIYSYMIKNSIENKLSISFSKLHTKYSRYHFKISLTYFKKLINKLEEINMIKINKEGKCNSYFINRETDIDTDIVADENIPQAVYNTNISDDINLLKSEIENTKESEIESNSNFQYDEYIRSNKKCTSFLDVKRMAEKILKEMKIRSEFIKNRFWRNIGKYYRNITIKHLESYIIKMIKDIRDQHYENYNKHVRNNNHKIDTSKRFANFTQREYDYELLEKQLLGIDY